MQWMEQVYWGNRLDAWITALAVVVGTVVVLAIVRTIAARRLKGVAERTSTGVDDAVAEIIRNTRWYFLFALSIKIASNLLALPESTHHALSVVVTLTLIVQAGIWGNTLIAFWFARTMQVRMSDDAAGTTSLAVVRFLGRVVLWTILFLVALASFDVNITAFITTLGVGGIAIALALQNVLGDLFASLSIVLDKPFVVGDSILVGQHQGTVERIGIKTTRLRSVDGEEIVIPNSELSNSRIRNFRRMEERRVMFTLNVPIGTPADVVERIPGVIAEIIAGIPGTRFERAHFLRIAETVLTIEAVYHVRGPDYLDYARIHQSVNLGILRQFKERGIELATTPQIVRLER